MHFTKVGAPTLESDFNVGHMKIMKTKHILILICLIAPLSSFASTNQLPTTVYISTVHTGVTFSVTQPVYIEPQLAEACATLAKQSDADPQALIVANSTTPVGHIWDLQTIVTNSGITNVTSVVVIDCRYVGSRRLSFQPFTFKEVRRPEPKLTPMFTPKKKSVQQAESTVPSKAAPSASSAVR